MHEDFSDNFLILCNQYWITIYEREEKKSESDYCEIKKGGNNEYFFRLHSQPNTQPLNVKVYDDEIFIEYFFFAISVNIFILLLCVDKHL